MPFCDALRAIFIYGRQGGDHYFVHQCYAPQRRCSSARRRQPPQCPPRLGTNEARAVRWLTCSRLGQQAVGLLESAGVRCSRADCARDVCAGEDEPVSALSLELRQPAPSRAAQHPLQVPHRQAFSGLRVDRRLALHAGPCRLRELRHEAVRAPPTGGPSGPMHRLKGQDVPSGGRLAGEQPGRSRGAVLSRSGRSTEITRRPLPPLGADSFARARSRPSTRKLSMIDIVGPAIDVRRKGRAFARPSGLFD